MKDTTIKVKCDTYINDVKMGRFELSFNLEHLILLPEKCKEKVVSQLRENTPFEVSIDNMVANECLATNILNEIRYNCHKYDTFVEDLIDGDNMRCTTGVFIADCNTDPIDLTKGTKWEATYWYSKVYQD